MKRFISFQLLLLAALSPAFATVKVTSPTTGSSVTSPVHYVASATTTCAKGVASMGIYVDNKLAYTVKGAALSTEIAVAPGAQRTVVEEWDNCGGLSSETVNLTIPAPKPTVSISASPSSVNAGSSSVLKVKAGNATKVALTGTDGSSHTLSASGGSETVKPSVTTTYTATATGSGGKATAKTTVTVNVPSPTVSIKASPASITAGSSSTLTVTATHATKVTISGSDGSSYTLSATGGTQSVKPPATTTYTASAVGTKTTVTAKTTVTVAVSAPTVSISANPNSITAGNSSTLTVAAANATTVSIKGSDGSSYPMSSTGGTQSVTPAKTTTYTVSATNSASTVTAGATVTVTTAPVTTVTLSANPTSIASGGSSTLTVVAANATSVTLTDGGTGNYPMTATGGSATVSPTSTTTYTATAFGASSTVQAQATVTVGPKALLSIAVTPNSASFPLGNTQQFTATATYNDSSTADVTSTASWSVANLAVATIDSSGLATSVASGATSVTASLNGVSDTEPFTVTITPGTGVNIPTWHGDAYRSGLNSNELSLTPNNVSAQNFGKLFSYVVNGFAYAQPLLVSGVTINGSTHNVLYVATETNDVYAFDADNYGTGAPLWHVTVMQSGEKPDNPGSSSTLQPTIGITSTPVIDTATNTMYVVSKQTPRSGGSFFRLSALDITTGAQTLGGPVTISASVPATNGASVNGVQTLTTSCIQRASLLEAYGNIYFGFGSCHTGWLLAYSATTLQQTGVFNASPHLDGEGTYASAGGVWMGGGGPASNGDGYVYITTGNGPYDGSTAWSDSVLQLDPNTLKVVSWFTPQYYQFMDCNDGDMASSGLLLIPGSSPPMALTGTKGGFMYLVNTNNLGGEQANDAGALSSLIFESDLVPTTTKTCTDSTGTLTFPSSPYQMYGSPAYFNGSVYLGVSPEKSGLPAGVRQFTLSGTTLAWGSYTGAATEHGIRGTTPFISSNGTSDGVLWFIDQNQPLGTSSPGIAILRALDPNNLANEFYNSNLNTGDAPGYGIKFTLPIVANGKVYISTAHTLTTASAPQSEIDVYGLN